MSSSHACRFGAFAGNIQNGTVPCHIVIRIHEDQLHVHALQNNDHLVNIVDHFEVLQGIFFQDQQMKQVFAA